MNTLARNPLADVDPRLLTEAFRRARERATNAEMSSSALFANIVEAARHGARDMYSLVKAAGATLGGAIKIAA